MSLLPSKPDLVSDAGPRVVGVDSEEADALLSALSSETARRILAELHEEPAPPAELSDRADTTLQNTQYHLSNLQEAGAVEVIGTAYSEKGREMDVYAPADQPLVIFAGQEQQASGIKAALSRLLGAVGALLFGSLAVQQVFGDGLGVGFGSSGGADGYDAGGGGGDGAAPTGSTATESPADTAADTAAGGAGGGESATPTAEPTPQPDDGGTTATATSDGPGIFSTGESTESATQTVADTVAATAEPATQTPTAAPTPSPAPEPTTTVQAASDGGVEVVGSLPPGLLFFLGGLTVLVVGLVLTSRM